MAGAAAGCSAEDLAGALTSHVDPDHQVPKPKDSGNYAKRAEYAGRIW